MIRAGRLRHLVMLQHPISSRDSQTGDVLRSWENFAQVWADVQPISGREFIAASAAQSEVTTRITIRQLAGVNASMRILHRGQIYNIHGVLADPQSGLEYLTLPCSEGTNDG